MAPDPNELLRIKAPKGDEVATATRHAYETLWKERGYTVVDDDGKPVRETAAAAKAGGDA